MSKLPFYFCVLFFPPYFFFLKQKIVSHSLLFESDAESWANTGQDSPRENDISFMVAWPDYHHILCGFNIPQESGG